MQQYPPSPFGAAFAFAGEIREAPHAVSMSSGERHWDIFARLCREAGAKGHLVSDAYFAAMAIEHGCDWISTDGDYARFKGRRWRRPF